MSISSSTIKSITALKAPFHVISINQSIAQSFVHEPSPDDGQTASEVQAERH